MNKEVKVTMTSTDGPSGIDHYEYTEGTEAKTSTDGILTYEQDTKTIIKARACDKAGNCSAYSDSKTVMIDQKAPEIEGVEEGKSYYLAYITYSDQGSGIDTGKTTFHDGTTEKPLANGSLFQGTASISLHVEDQAGNSTEVKFQSKEIPKIEDLTEEDQDIIDQIEEEYKKVKEELDKEKQQEIEDWIKEAKEKLDSFITEVEDPNTTVKVEGVDDTKFREETKLIVEVVTEKIDMTEIRLDEVEGLDEETEVKAAYDIYLELDGTKIQPDGKVRVKIPYTEEMKTWEDIKVVYIDDDKKITIYPHEIEKTEGKEYVVFETTHFSQYAVVGKAKETIQKKEVNIDTDEDGLPDINLDFDDDGIAELNIDNDPANNTKTRVPDIDIDTDGDGKANVNIDTDGDGKADENIKTVGEWKPEKDCEYKEMKYDTMSKAGETGKEAEEPKTSSVQGSNTGVPNNAGGAKTGDDTSVIALIGIISLSLSAVCFMIYKKKEE